MAVAGALALACAGCKNDDAVVLRPPAAPDLTDPVSLALDIQPTFTASCALSGCHAGAFPVAGLTLEEGRLYEPGLGAVGVASAQAPLLRIEPGASDRSYLVDKLEGTQGQVGGVGARMPLGGPPVSAEFLEALRTWIDDGAPDN
ncbi:MAG: hypothetical protein Kow0062_04150 [Acidobacteriota bacterium]